MSAGLKKLRGARGLAGWSASWRIFLISLVTFCIKAEIEDS
jgi:hypothetical protein